MSSKQLELSKEKRALRQTVAKELIAELEKSVARAELMELFYQRKTITGDRSVQLTLGKTQGELKLWNELLEFLNSKLDK